MTIITALFSDFAPHIAGFVALLVGLVGWGAKKKRDGRKQAENDNLKDAIDRGKRGLDAMAKEQAETDGLSNSDIVDRMRRRDSDFTGL